MSIRKKLFWTILQWFSFGIGVGVAYHLYDCKCHKETSYINPTPEQSKRLDSIITTLELQTSSANDK